MALDQKFFKKSTTAATGLADQEQGLTVHIDANDVDSYDGDGPIWYDIAGHEVTIPLADKARNLQLHLNASDTTSYSGSGTIWTDISGNSRHGIINGGVESTYATGIRGSFDFAEGTGDYVNVTHHADIKPSSNGVTYEFWITPEEISGTDTYLYTGSTSGYGSVYFRLENGVPYQTAYNSSNAVVTNTNTGTALTAGSLHHVVLTISNITNPVTKLYQDGTLKATHTGSGTIHYLTEDLKIGRYTTGNANDFNGLIHAVRVYNTVLTAAEVGQNYRAGNFLNYSSVITSKHEATQGSLITALPVQGTLHTSNLQIDLDANSYSGSGNWLDGANDYDASVTSSHATYVNNDNSDYFNISGTTSNPISISHNNILNAAARTWEFWVWFDADQMSFFGGQWSSTASEKVIMFRMKDSNNAIRAQCYSGSSGFSASEYLEPTTDNNVVNLNEWNHIVFTSDNSSKDFKIYVNGVEKYSNTLQFNINTSSSLDFIIGGVYSSSNLDGRIAQFRYYNAALTSAQVTTNYNATKNLYQGITSLELKLDANGYTSGTWSDTSGNNRHATVTGATYTNDGNSDYFDFNGSGNYAETSFSQNWASIPFSVEMWFNTDSRNGEYMWGLNESSSMAYGVGASVRGSGNSYHLQFLGSGLIVSAGPVETNRWYHLVFTSDGTTKKAYLDGELKGTGTTTINSGANGQPFIFGRYGTYNGGYFNGKIAQARIYNGTMAASQVKTNYDATKALYQNPILKLHFDASDIDTTANTWTDKVSSLVLTKSGTSSYDAELGDFLQLGGGYYGNDSAAVQVKDSVGDFTVEYFMQHVFDGSYAILGIMQNSSQRGLFLATTSSYILNYNYNLNATSSAGQEISTPTNHLTANKWHHVVFVYDSSTNIKFYVDGVLKVTTSVASSSSWTTTDGIRIGDMETLSYGSNGKMGYLKMYQGKLSDAQIVQNYLATKSQFPNGHNATIGGSPTWGTNSSPAYNYFGFDSNSEYLSIPDSSDFDLVENQSLEIWVYNDHSGPQHYINKPGSPGGYSWQLYWQSSNHSFQMHNTGNSGITVSAGTNSANTWAHIVLTVGNTQDYKLYLNAGTPGTGTLSGTPSTSTVPVTIGRYYPTSTYGLQGRIGMIKFYAKTLSATEVTTAYNNTKGTYGIT